MGGRERGAEREAEGGRPERGSEGGETAGRRPGEGMPGEGENDVGEVEAERGLHFPSVVFDKGGRDRARGEGDRGEGGKPGEGGGRGMAKERGRERGRQRWRSGGRMRGLRGIGERGGVCDQGIGDNRSEW